MVEAEAGGDQGQQAFLYFACALYDPVHAVYRFPVVISMILSFTYFNMLEFPRFVGWDNYTRLFLEDDIFLVALKNTLLRRHHGTHQLFGLFPVCLGHQ